MHTKRGYILFLLFTILSVCSVLISLYFSQVVIYRQLMHILITKEKTNRLALSGINLTQALITPKTNQNDEKNSTNKTAKLSPEQTLLSQLFGYWNKQISYTLSLKTDGFDGNILLSIQSEQGKLNLNSLFDFEKKQFISEGKPDDRKKLCTWLFEKIANLTKKPSLFPAFEKYLMSRTTAFNDVTELMEIKEFSDIFYTNLFITFDEQKQNQAADQTPKEPSNNIFLTDIFTVCTEQDTINPWLFSYSWCKILDLKPKKILNDEEKQKIFSTLSKNQNWELDWNKCVKDLYQKDYKDLASEIKSILTTQFEANIFSLLLTGNIGETNSTIFTIVKSVVKDNLVSFEIMKTYQI